MRVLDALTLVALATLALASPAPAEDESTPGNEERSTPTTVARWDDAGRFYLLFQTGLVFLFDDEFAGNVHDESHEFPGSNINIPIGLSLGYNLSKHFGVELQGVGTEPDVRSDGAFGKLAEYSNISVFGSLRYRYPMGDGRFVPWGLGGIGWSLNAINDATTPRVKVSGDGSTIAGTLALGFDYFLADDVAVGASAQSFIYPSIDTEVFNKDTGEHLHGSNNLTSMALLVHTRVFPGKPRSADGTGVQREAFFDTDERRYYLFGTGGDHVFFDDKYGGGVTAKAAGSSNWTLGGGGGVNLDKHWGVELALLSDSDLNIDDGDLGKIGEMGIFTILPTARYRWQFWGGRLVPFATAGIGVAINRPNDPRNIVDVFQKGSRRTPKYDIQSTSVAGSVGIGLEYFLNHHLSIGLGVPLMIYPDWDTTVQQRDKTGASVGQPVKSSWNYTGIFPNVRLTAYVP
jgi:outer membrane protein with beta-barrel domain